MFRVLVPVTFGVALLASLGMTQDRPTTSAAAAKGDKESVERFLEAYVAAFNKNQVETVAGFWSPQCVYVDRETGERTEGRAAIRSDTEKLFKEHPGAKITVELGAIRFIRPDVATVDGRSTAYFSKADPSTTDFSTILVKEDGKWLIDNVQETAVPTPPTASSALRELEWLVGDWKDDSPGITVECSVGWAANQSFLVRSYKVQRDNEAPWEGSQVIGWDARTKQIRSWTFDSDGSFDEGVWSKRGDSWSVTLTRTLEDGGLANGTQVIKKVNPDTYTVQLIAREVNGEPAPASEIVKVVRIVKKPESK